MSDTLVDLTTGRFQPKQIAGQLYAQASGCGGVRVTQLESDGLELTRAGRRFQISQSAGVTGIAPVAAVPTTAAQWSLFNASTTDSLVLENVGLLLASGTAAAGIILMGAYFTLPVQTGLVSNMTVTNLNGSSTRTSAVAIKSGVTVTTPAAPSWFTLAKSDSANTAVLSVAVINENIKGRIIVPPGYGLALAALSGTGTSPLFTPVAQWTEFALDLE